MNVSRFCFNHYKFYWKSRFWPHVKVCPLKEFVCTAPLPWLTKLKSFNFSIYESYFGGCFIVYLWKYFSFIYIYICCFLLQLGFNQKTKFSLTYITVSIHIYCIVISISEIEEDKERESFHNYLEQQIRAQQKKKSAAAPQQSETKWTHSELGYAVNTKLKLD